MRHSRKRRWASVSVRSVAAQQLSLDMPAIRTHSAYAPVEVLHPSTTPLVHRVVARATGAVSQDITPRKAPKRWWLALCFKHIAAQAWERDEQPTVVCDEPSSWVLAANRAAREYRITVGSSRAEALWRCGELRCVRFDRLTLQRNLERLAWISMRFTPWVSIQAPDTLLLELHGSVRLWKGIKPLLQEIEQCFAAEGPLGLAMAPTPLGARWLSRLARKPIPVAYQMDELRALLDQLPLTVLADTPALHQLVQRAACFGVKQLSALQRLPRAGLQRRLGVAFVKQMDQAYGRVAEVPCVWVEPLRFKSQWEGDEPLTQAIFLKHICQGLLDELSDFLHRHAGGVSEVYWTLWHPAPSRLGDENRDTQPLKTQWRWRLPTVTADAAVWLDVGGAGYFERALPAPVVAVQLRSARVRMDIRSDALFTHAHARPEESAQLQQQWIERVGRRLGRTAVQYARIVAQHCPERASVWGCAQMSMSSQPLTSPSIDEPLRVLGTRRPLWILADPKRLIVRHRRPWLDGPVEFVEGPERIESGWWDPKQSIGRDYYVIQDAKARTAWIFREIIEPQAWYLHGWFA